MPIRVTKESPDAAAFDAMEKATEDKSSNMFTESEYNINATNEERLGYDYEAYRFLQQLFKEDKSTKASIKNWDFDRYLANLKGSYLEEKFIHSKEGDPDYYSKAGSMLRSVYSDDVEQMVLSAKNFKGDLPSRVGKKKSRKNISIKAPGAKSY